MQTLNFRIRFNACKGGSREFITQEVLNVICEKHLADGWKVRKLKMGQIDN